MARTLRCPLCDWQVDAAFRLPEMLTRLMVSNPATLRRLHEANVTALVSDHLASHDPYALARVLAETLSAPA